MVDPIAFALEILAVFLGVAFAFALDRHQQKVLEKRESIRVLGLIKQELQDNQTVLDKMKTEFQRLKSTEGFTMPFYHMRFSIWQGISGKVDTIKNEQVLAEVSQVYFNYDTFERTLDTYLDLAMTLVKQGSSEIIRSSMETRLAAMKLQMEDSEEGKGLLTLTKETISDIEKEVERLRDP
jgi:hypothetical protein